MIFFFIPRLEEWKVEFDRYQNNFLNVFNFNFDKVIYFFI